MSDRKWYYTVGAKHAGPVFETALLQLFQNRQLRPDTMVWTEGMGEWVAASAIEGLVPAAHCPPTLPLASAVAGGYAGFWLRVVAAIIDIFILVAGVSILALFLAHAGGVFTNLAAVVARHIGVSWAIGWLYSALLESSSKQATLGKMAAGIVVTDLDGSRICFIRATVRYFGKTISHLILFIGFIMAAFTERKQTLHDMMAGCLVMKK